MNTYSSRFIGFLRMGFVENGFYNKEIRILVKLLKAVAALFLFLLVAAVVFVGCKFLVTKSEFTARDDSRVELRVRRFNLLEGTDSMENAPAGCTIKDKDVQNEVLSSAHFAYAVQELDLTMCLDNVEVQHFVGDQLVVRVAWHCGTEKLKHFSDLCKKEGNWIFDK